MNKVRTYAVGFELNSDTSQISIYSEKEKDAIPLPSKTGSTEGRFPTALFKRAGSDEWFAGIEAGYYEHVEKGTSVRHLLTKAESGSTQLIDGKRYTGQELLAEYFRAALRMLGTEDAASAVSRICVTGRTVHEAFADAVHQALSLLGFKPEQILIAAYDECFYRYVYAQKPELWTRGSLLLEVTEDDVTASRMTEYRVRKPAYVKMEELGQAALPRDASDRDRAFSEAVREWTGGKSFSSIFLSGRGFGREWAKESLPILMKSSSKIFAGDNLYLKGACMIAEKFAEGNGADERIFDGSESLKASLSIDASDKGKPAVLTLLKAGENRFLAGTECELILGDVSFLLFVLTSYPDGKRRTVRMDLDGLPNRPPRATRIGLSVKMTDRTHAAIHATDLGFGDLYPASMKEWHSVLELV